MGIEPTRAHSGIRRGHTLTGGNGNDYLNGGPGTDSCTSGDTTTACEHPNRQT